MEFEGLNGKKEREAESVKDGGDEEKLVFDSSVDHRGNVPLRASTGVWKASLIIIAIEFCERLSFFGLATNLIIYLTKVLHKEVKLAAKSVNYWFGVTTLMPLLGGFVADAYLGRFATVLLSSIIYLAGIVLLMLSQLIPGLKPCSTNPCLRSSETHEIVFFMAMYLISIGTGGHRPSLQSFGADQFDDDHPDERKKKMSFFNWWNFSMSSGLLLGVTVVVYIEDNVSWGVADGVLTAVMGFSIFVFIAGRPLYRYKKPDGSPLTPMIQVLVAALVKRKLPCPANAKDLYEVNRPQKNDKRLLQHTDKFRFLDKAAIIQHTTTDPESQEKLDPWRLATVTQVEEVKIMLSMVPVWLTSLPFGVCVAQSGTFFVKQASTMDRCFADVLVIPPASLFCLGAIGMIISVTFYEKVLVPFLRRATGSERPISIRQRIGIGMVFPVIAMAAAALVENKRLSVAHKEGNPTMVSMRVFWLFPQFVILSLGDGFTLVGLQEFFYGQVPDNMRSLGIAFYLSVMGAGNFMSSLLITVVDHTTNMAGKTSWFGNDLNRSRLDYYYWLLAAISAVNLCVYVFVTRKYSYKSVQHKVAIAKSPEGNTS